MLVIRAASVKDISKIQELVTKLQKARKKNYSKETTLFHKRVKEYSKITANNLKKEIYLVAEHKGEVVGFISGKVYTLNSLQISQRGSIENLFIDEQFRKKGFAKKLLDALQKEFKKRGCGLMTLMTDIENCAAQNLYSSIGMKQVTVEFWKKV